MKQVLKVMVVGLFITGMLTVRVQAQAVTPPAGDTKAKVAAIRADMQSLRDKMKLLRAQMDEASAKMRALRDQMKPLWEKMRADREQLKQLIGPQPKPMVKTVK